jgi:hypothetical protein
MSTISKKKSEKEKQIERNILSKFIGILFPLDDKTKDLIGVWTIHETDIWKAIEKLNLK